MSEKYVYHGMDITVDIYEKICSIAEIISAHENITFEQALQGFAESVTYEALQIPETLMWSESSEYIVDEYYRNRMEE